MKYSFLLFLASFLFFLNACKQNDPQIAKIEELCLSESIKMAGESEGIVEYCACASPKILAQVKNNKTIMAKFEKGEFNHIYELGDSTFTAVLNNCLQGDLLVYNPPSMEFILPERAENSIRVTLMDEKSPEFQTIHNMEKYCDCYIQSIKTKLTFEEFHDRNIDELPKYKAILEDCEKASKN